MTGEETRTDDKRVYKRDKLSQDNNNVSSSISRAL